MALSETSTAMLALLGLFAGWLGAVVGIGGGIVLVPVLVLAFGFDIRVAVATSLVAVVATSTAAGSAYVGRGLANMRLGMTLEVATTIGGITGGLLAVLIAPSVLSGIFAVMMVVTAVLVARGKSEHHEEEPDDADAVAAPTTHAAAPALAMAGAGAPAAPLPSSDDRAGWETHGQLAGAYYDPQLGKLVRYRAKRLPLGVAVSLLAGTVSGMLGVGGGFLKVPAMSLGMRVPIKVAAATSNFMIGVTAIASLFVYFARGYVHPYAAAPVTIGVVGGAIAGAATSSLVHPRHLQRLLVGVLVVVAIQMALKAGGVTLGR